MNRHTLPIPYLLVMGLMLTVSLLASAQEMTVHAPKSVYVGDNFTVQFSINDQAKDFRGPTFKGFSLRSGPNQSSSTSMSFINGQMSRSVNTTFSYTLTADLEGSFTVGPASCTADGKKISSNSFTIKVEKPTAAQQQQRQQQQAQQRRQAYDPWAQQPQEETKIDETTLFARATKVRPIRENKSSSPTKSILRYPSASLPSTNSPATAVSGPKISARGNR